MFDRYKITLNGKSRIVTASEVMQASQEMVSENNNDGTDIKVQSCDAEGNLKSGVAQISSEVLAIQNDGKEVVQEKPAPVYSTWTSQVVDHDAKKRLEEMHKKIEAAGVKIDTSQQLYETGTRMAAEGYATQEKRKREFDKKQNLSVAADELNQIIYNEKREDVMLSAKDIAKSMTTAAGILYCDKFRLTEHTIKQIMNRLKAPEGSPNPAKSYILGLQERATQDLVHEDIQKILEVFTYECNRFPDVVFRLRRRSNPHDIFAAVSPIYGVNDAPSVTAQFLAKLPNDVKGSFDYDEETTTWELNARVGSPTPVQEMAVGEPFEIGPSARSNDRGEGMFNVAALIEILRCLNASTYLAKGSEASRTHRGAKTAVDIAKMIDAAMKSSTVLINMWAANRSVEIALPVVEDKIVPFNEAMPGFWRFLLTDKRSELAGVLVGRNEVHVKELTKAFDSERRDKDKLVRADFGQAFTKYIQKMPAEIRQDAENAAGSWIVNSKSPIQYLAPKKAA